MSRAFCVFLVFLLHLGFTGFGQDKSGVAVHSDPRLDAVLKKKPPASKKKHAAAKKPKSKKTVSKTAKSKHRDTKHPASDKIAKTKKKKLPVLGESKGGAYSGDGFRVQIYNGPDRYKAQKTQDEFEQHYPGVHTYLNYIAPCYRVKVGDYKSKHDAMGMFREASSTYFPCMIVPDKVVIN
jgi:hypothetical protein